MMKRFVTILALFFLALPAAAQYAVGGWGGPTVKIAPVNGEVIAMMGGEGGALFFYDNYALGIGGAGHSSLGKEQLSWGGFKLRAMLFPEKTFQLDFALLAGGGKGIDLNELESNFGMLEPEIGLAFNTGSFTKIRASVGYRHLFGAKEDAFVLKDLRGLTFGFNMAFGSD